MEAIPPWGRVFPGLRKGKNHRNRKHWRKYVKQSKRSHWFPGTAEKSRRQKTKVIFLDISRKERGGGKKKLMKRTIKRGLLMGRVRKGKPSRPQKRLGRGGGGVKTKKNTVQRRRGNAGIK